MFEEIDVSQITVGVVGLGLMGSSIAVTLLISGHPVKAISPVEKEINSARSGIRTLLNECERMGLLKSPPESYLSSLTFSESYKDLGDCKLVNECVIEDMEIKKQVYGRIESVVKTDTVIATNTSAIPISELQSCILHPERFIGIHWAEPAFATRFMEIISGDKTDPEIADWVYKLSHFWHKEPTLLKRDIRGFVTNRLMYAATREILSSIEKGVVSMEDADKATRYDAGSWMTLMGIFRRMDYLGLSDYKVIFENLFPMLDNRDTVPEIMNLMEEHNCKGVHNLKGLYEYTRKSADKWKKAFTGFNKEIFALAAGYPEDSFRINN